MTVEANPLMTRFLELPSLVGEEWTASLESNFNLLLKMEHCSEMLAQAGGSDEGFWPAEDSWAAQYRPYKVSNGVLTIPIAGVMLNNFSYATPYATGYQYISRAWSRGMSDPAVKGIVLSINSGGGEASGNFDLVDKMAATKTKPVAAIVEHAYSAAYAIATVGDEIATSRTGGVGSVGVVVGHLDASENMKQRGFKMTFISAPKGGDKTEGNMYEPLSAAAQERMQDRVDELYDHFVSTVARNRGMEDKAVRATRARTFTASQALSNGMADKVAPAEDSMAAFMAALSSSNGDANMSANENGATVSAADLAEATASARTEGHTAGRTEGVTAERTRVQTVLDSDEAKGRPAATRRLLKTDMSAEEIVGLLADLPAEATASTGTETNTNAHQRPEFKEGMNAGGGANVQAGSEGSGEGGGEKVDQLTRVRQSLAAQGVSGFAALAKKP